MAAKAEALYDGTLWSRTSCSKCNRSCKFYCPYCMLIVGKPQDVVVPQLSLPVHIDIVFNDGIKKSTAVHAKLLAPGDVDIHEYPADIPTFDPKTSAIVYPSDDATVLADLEDVSDLEHLILIDSPWQKSKAIIMHEKLAHLPRIKLKSPPERSEFWRYHSEGKGCVSTIEAIRLIVKEYGDATNQYMSTAADLLYFFNLLGSYIRKRRANEPEIPMDERVKEKYRRLRDQKEKGRRVRAERVKAKEEVKKHKVRIPSEFDVEKMRCFNCRELGHQATDCPQPCRYCKQMGHWNRQCEQRGKINKNNTVIPPKVQA